jgi:Na+/H+ antiporter NhaD/arsenite permease-like protein
MTPDQIIATVIFLGVFAILIWGKIHRAWVALGGAVLASAIIIQSPHKIWGAVNWETIIFIFGMMVMVEGMARSGFFRWLCLRVAKMMGYDVPRIFIAFMLVSGFLSMFIDSITVLLFLAAIIIELARLLKFNPVPLIIAAIFAANTGGSATMSGDPPNIIIGTSFGLSFFDFLINTGLIAWVGMIAALIFFYFVFRKTLQPAGVVAVDVSQLPQPAEAITDRRLFRLSTLIFLMVVSLLVTHHISHIHVDKIGWIAAGSTLLAVLWVKLTAANSGWGTAFKGDLDVLKGVDWRTLLFFLGLFITVGGMEDAGMMDKVANWIGDAAGKDLYLAITMILWISAFASAIIDNIPFAMAMVPVVESLSGTHNWSKATLSWPLALGTDIGGNGTPIGASANVVGIAIAEREGYRISWGTYCKYALPGMIMVVGICNAYLILRYA